jgi:hypothetical protein
MSGVIGYFLSLIKLLSYIIRYFPIKYLKINELPF